MKPTLASDTKGSTKRSSIMAMHRRRYRNVLTYSLPP